MAVVIREMSLPRDCKHCTFGTSSGTGLIQCTAVKPRNTVIVHQRTRDGRPSWCPLEEIDLERGSGPPDPDGQRLESEAGSGSWNPEKCNDDRRPRCFARTTERGRGGGKCRILKTTYPKGNCPFYKAGG